MIRSWDQVADLIGAGVGADHRERVVGLIAKSVFTEMHASSWRGTLLWDLAWDEVRNRVDWEVTFDVTWPIRGRIAGSL